MINIKASNGKLDKIQRQVIKQRDGNTKKELKGKPKNQRHGEVENCFKR